MSKLTELQLDVDELRRLLDLSSRPSVREFLLHEAQEHEKTIKRLKLAEEAKKAAESDTATIKPKCYDVKLTTYAWDQSDKFVKIFVTLKNVHTLPEDKVQCLFTERSLELKAFELDGKNFSLPIQNLFDKIDPAKSYKKVKSDEVVIFACKASPFKNWSAMTGIEKRAKEASQPKMDSSDPEAGLMSLMQKMYQDGDDDMKRTIAKAWTESREKKGGDGAML